VGTASCTPVRAKRGTQGSHCRGSITLTCQELSQLPVTTVSGGPWTRHAFSPLLPCDNQQGQWGVQGRWWRGRDAEERVTGRPACISIHVISLEGAEPPAVVQLNCSCLTTEGQAFLFP